MKLNRYMPRKALPKRNALVIALAVGMGISGLAFGQATTGAIFGQAPAGDTVTATSATGFSRTVQVRSNGSYSITALPAGTYTVTVKNDNGAMVSTRHNVGIAVGGGVQVAFGPGASATNAEQLKGVTVSANALPTIDVTTVHNSTILTAQQLHRLPVAHSATAIALLTPGTIASSAFAGINFGGSSVAENAHYVNGYNTGSPYNNVSAYYLPFGAIATQQTLAGGFGAKYGRSDGGVINQIGKRGTNEWHFGAQIRWEPRSLQAHNASTYWPYETLPSQPFCVPSTADPNVCGSGTEMFTHAPN